MLTGGVSQFHQIFLHSGRNSHLCQFFPCCQQLCRSCHRLALRHCRRTGQQGKFLFLFRIPQRQTEQKAVQLCLQQRKCPLHLHRVLGGDHEKRLLQRIRYAVRSDLPFFHALQQCRLGAGRGTVDLVRKQNLGEHCPFPKRKRTGFRLRNAHADQVGRQQVWCKLDTVKVRVQCSGKGTGKGGFSGSRNIVQQHVSPAVQGGKHLFDHIFFAVNAGRDRITEGLGKGCNFRHRHSFRLKCKAVRRALCSVSHALL